MALPPPLLAVIRAMAAASPNPSSLDEMKLVEDDVVEILQQRHDLKGGFPLRRKTSLDQHEGDGFRRGNDELASFGALERVGLVEAQTTDVQGGTLLFQTFLFVRGPDGDDVFGFIDAIGGERFQQRAGDVLGETSGRNDEQDPLAGVGLDEALKGVAFTGAGRRGVDTDGLIGIDEALLQRR